MTARQVFGAVALGTRASGPHAGETPALPDAARGDLQPQPK